MSLNCSATPGRAESRPAVAETGVDGLRIAVVGGASGIGSALTQLLRRRAASVVVVDSNPSAEVSVDIGTPEGCEVAMAQSITILGGLDGLAITAGITSYARIEDTHPGLWRHMLDVNLVAAALLSRQALSALEVSESPAIVV